MRAAAACLCLIALLGLPGAHALLVPVEGEVFLFRNLPRHSLAVTAAVDAVSRASVVDSESVRGTKLCDLLAEEKRLNSNSLLLIIGELHDGFCNVHSFASAVVQIAVSGESVQMSVFDGSTATSFTSPRIRADAPAVEMLLKAAFFDVLSHRHLQGGDISVADIQVGRTPVTRWLARPPAWIYVLIGAALVIFVQKKLASHNLMSEASAARQELDLIRTEEVRFAKREDFSGKLNVPISADEFRRWMRITTEFIIDYYEHPEVYDVTTKQKPGFLYEVLPKEAPNAPETFDAIMHDIYAKIMPGLTHWQHPRFHAYFCTGQSYPDIVAEAISSGLGVVGFCWDSAPAFTELEIAMVNWVGRAFGLPESFLFQGNSESSKGGGALQDSASDSILVALLAARHRFITEICGKVELGRRNKEHEILKNLVAYASTEAHSSIEKAALLTMVHMRPIKPDARFSMRGADLEKQVVRDKERGNTPFFVHVTLGTTSVCSFDNLREILIVAKKHNLWVHVDAAYAGSAWVCPEFRYQMDGIQEADSVDINLHKMFLHSASVSILWTRNQRAIKESMSVDPTYLKARYSGATEFRHWGIPLSRRSKCLKLWFVLRCYGITGMQAYVRRLVRLTSLMRELLEKDARVEIVGEQHLALVAFKLRTKDLKDSNLLTTELCEYINKSRKLVVTHAKPNGIDVVRISISHQLSAEREIEESYRILSDLVDEFLMLSKHTVVTYPHFNADCGVAGSPGVTTNTLQTYTTHSSIRTTETRLDTNQNHPASSTKADRSATSINLARERENQKEVVERPSERLPNSRPSPARDVTEERPRRRRKGITPTLSPANPGRRPF